jgi:hypothetical protein
MHFSYRKSVLFIWGSIPAQAKETSGLPVRLRAKLIVAIRQAARFGSWGSCTRADALLAS